MILENHYLLAPASAKWVERRILKHEGAWFQAYFKVDAQNQFGAMLRNNLCVVVHDTPDGKTQWYKRQFVEAECNPQNEEILDLHRKMNNWTSLAKIDIANQINAQFKQRSLPAYVEALGEDLIVRSQTLAPEALQGATQAIVNTDDSAAPLRAVGFTHVVAGDSGGRYPLLGPEERDKQQRTAQQLKEKQQQAEQQLQALQNSLNSTLGGIEEKKGEGEKKSSLSSGAKKRGDSKAQLKKESGDDLLKVLDNQH